MNMKQRICLILSALCMGCLGAFIVTHIDRGIFVTITVSVLSLMIGYLLSAVIWR